MKKSVLLVLSLVLVVIVSGCVNNQTQTGNTAASEQQVQPNEIGVIGNENTVSNKISETQQKEIELIQNLSKRYEGFHNINFSKIDCKNPDYYNADLMNLSIDNWINEYYNPPQTAIWYPSLGEGRIGSVQIYFKNIGCTRVVPVYGSIVVFNNSIIFSKLDKGYSNYMNSLYPEGFYPNDFTRGTFSVSENIRDTVIVKATGNYTVWVYMINNNTNNIVAIDKLDLTMR